MAQKRRSTLPLATLLVGSVAVAWSPDTATPPTTAIRNGRPDFDFLFGRFKVRSRRLLATDQPRWEQAISPDGGQTWETNWVMEFTRVGGRQ